MRRRAPSFKHAIAGALLALMISSCAPTEKTVAPDVPLSITPTTFSSLQGWASDDHATALDAFRRSCRRVIDGAETPRAIGGMAEAPETWRGICDGAFRIRPDDGQAARLFFERHFRPYAAHAGTVADGLFTGYYEAELSGALKQSDRFSVPIYAAPSNIVSVDLGLFDTALAGRTITGQRVDNRVRPLPDRAAIEGGALSGRGLELVWVDSAVDAFFLHVQGSGQVRLEDGTVRRVGFAARNGHPYTAIGRHLIADGEIPAAKMSMQAIREWIAANPDRGRALMEKNKSFIFFRFLDGEGPVGASGVELTPGRSLAVDTAHVPFGVPIWLETTDPTDPATPINRLLVAQDTGAAIRGAIRGDVFWGFGADAAAKAGAMKERGRYFLLLPETVAAP